MDIRTKERMDVIMENINVWSEHKDEVILKVEDGVYENFGRVYYYIDFSFVNKSNEQVYYWVKTDRISFYLNHESRMFISSRKHLKDINDQIKKEHEWVINMVEYMTKGTVIIECVYPTLIKETDTNVPVDKEEYKFPQRESILEGYEELTREISRQERELERLREKELGLAIEYYNRKKGYNIGDVVRCENHYGESEFGVVTSQSTYKIKKDKDEEYLNEIERNYSQYSDITLILKSGKAKKQTYGFYKVLDVLCKEKDFGKLCLEHGVKPTLNKDNVTKLYNIILKVRPKGEPIT
jgi:hypothetical protein